MKFLVAILVLSTLTFPGASPRAAAPDLLAEPMVNLAGETASLADFRGEVIVVNFWASWCAPCREELPLLDSWNTEWIGKGARVVAVSIDKRIGNAERFIADADLDLTILVDGPDGLAADLDLAAVPSTFLLDRDGQVVMSVRGFAIEDLARLKKAVEDLMGPVAKGGSA